MKTATLAAILVCVALTPAFAASDPGFDINTYCRQSHELDGRRNPDAEAYCRSQEAEARQRVRRMQVTPATMGSCVENAARTSTSSYMLFEGCLKVENQAKTDLLYRP